MLDPDTHRPIIPRLPPSKLAFESGCGLTTPDKGSRPVLRKFTPGKLERDAIGAEQVANHSDGPKPMDQRVTSSEELEMDGEGFPLIFGQIIAGDGMENGEIMLRPITPNVRARKLQALALAKANAETDIASDMKPKRQTKPSKKRH